MIIKVQIRQFDSKDRTMMLAYNEDRSIEFEGEATKDVIKKMKNEPKKFFHADTIPDPNKKNAKRIVILNEAKWQNW